MTATTTTTTATARCEFRPAATDAVPVPVLTDPTTVTFRVQTPAGVITDRVYPTGITRISTGIYTADVVLDAADVWRWEWIGTGTVAGTSAVMVVRVVAGIPAP